jgi:hypothetical protein
MGADVGAPRFACSAANSHSSTGPWPSLRRVTSRNDTQWKESVCDRVPTDHVLRAGGPVNRKASGSGARPSTATSDFFDVPEFLLPRSLRRRRRASVAIGKLERYDSGRSTAPYLLREPACHAAVSTSRPGSTIAFSENFDPRFLPQYFLPQYDEFQCETHQRVARYAQSVA